MVEDRRRRDTGLESAEADGGWSLNPRRLSTASVPMPSDERLNLLLDTLAQVAISVELQPTLQILLDSLHTLVPFDAGGIFVHEADRQVVRARAARGYPGDLEMPASDGIVGEVIRSGQSRLVRDVRGDPTYMT